MHLLFVVIHQPTIVKACIQDNTVSILWIAEVSDLQTFGCGILFEGVIVAGVAIGTTDNELHCLLQQLYAILIKG